MIIKATKKRFIPKSNVYHQLNRKERETVRERTMVLAIQKICQEPISTDIIYKIKLRLNKFRLFPMEICQLLDVWPRNLLDLQLVIEEMEERFNVGQLETILEIFRANEYTLQKIKEEN